MSRVDYHPSSLHTTISLLNITISEIYPSVLQRLKFCGTQLRNKTLKKIKVCEWEECPRKWSSSTLVENIRVCLRLIEDDHRLMASESWNKAVLVLWLSLLMIIDYLRWGTDATLCPIKYIGNCGMGEEREGCTYQG